MANLLKEIWPCHNPENYKVHFARRNPRGRKVNPLDDWVEDRAKWIGWQESRPERDQFNRPCIFSLMQFYHEEDIWLFGGIFRVTARFADRYKVELTEELEDCIGRLKIRSSYRSRTVRVKLENHYEKFTVSEVLGEPYSG